MSEVVWKYPDDYETAPPEVSVRYSSVVKVWAEEQGINPNEVCTTGFHITREADGSLLAHGKQWTYFDDGDGRRYRMLNETEDGWIGEWKTWPVSSVPDVSEVTA